MMNIQQKLCYHFKIYNQSRQMKNMLAAKSLQVEAPYKDILIWHTIENVGTFSYGFGMVHFKCKINIWKKMFSLKISISIQEFKGRFVGWFDQWRHHMKGPIHSLFTTSHHACTFYAHSLWKEKRKFNHTSSIHCLNLETISWKGS